MKKNIIIILFTTFLFSQEVSITNVSVQQRTDGSKLVDIFYDLSGDLVFPSFDVRVYANNTPKDNNCIFVSSFEDQENTWLCGYNDGIDNVYQSSTNDTYSCLCDNEGALEYGECYSIDCESFQNGGNTPPSINGLQNPNREFRCTEFDGEEYCLISNISGDVYQNIQPGQGKHIVWDLSKEYTNLELDNMKIKIMASGHEIVDNLPFQVVQIPAGSYYSVQSNQMETVNYDYEIMINEVTNAEYAQFLIAALEQGEININVCGYNPDELLYDSNNEVMDHFGNYSIASECSECNEDMPDEFCNGDLFSIHGNIFYGNGYLDLSLNAPYMYFEHPTPNIEIGSNNKITFNGNTFVVEEGYGNHPVTNVTWQGANAFAEFYGMRLPNRIEWERSAVSDTSNFGQFWPWGEWLFTNDNQGNLIDYIASNFDSDCSTCMSGEWNDGFEGTSPVGFYNGSNLIPGTNTLTQDGRSSYGLNDLAGNAFEYLHEFEYEEDYAYPLLIGGGWNISVQELSTWNGVATMIPQSPSNEYVIFGSSGFRCVRTK